MSTLEPILHHLAGNARITAIGLQQIAFESRDDWKAFGVLLYQWHRAWPWILGDWWNDGERWLDNPEPGTRNPEPARRLPPAEERALYQAISRKTHLGDDDEQRTTLYAHLSTVAYVSRHVPVSIRIQNVPWTHHREVAPLERKEQVRLLKLCASEGWTVMDLREEIRGTRPEPEAPVAAFVVQRWKNEFLREVAKEDIREWTPERRAATKAELLPIVDFWRKL